MITNDLKINFDFSNKKKTTNKNIFNSKDILKMNPKLLITANDNVIYEVDNMQTLYLYPLTLLDYIDNLFSKHIIFINIINISKAINYIELFSNDIFKHLKAIEILIKEDYDDEQFSKINELINYFYNKKIKITLNIKNIYNLSKKINYYPFISYFKIFLPNILDTIDFKNFIDEIRYISNYTSKETLIHVKTYLNIEQSKYYEFAIKEFTKLKVDIFQVSKELIPIDFDNVDVNIDVQKTIRSLEQKYNTYNITKFISVKDLSKLYYPRFELDDRNSRKCYACQMKPYLYNEKILPCKVQMIFNDMDLWTANYDNQNKYLDIVKKCGKNCSDCASIFENDVLWQIEKIVKENNEELKFYLRSKDDRNNWKKWFW